jgi:hypothetical protein
VAPGRWKAARNAGLSRQSAYTKGQGSRGQGLLPPCRPRQRQVGKSPQPTRAEPDQADSEIPNPDSTTKNMTGHAVNVGLRPTQSNRQPIARAQGPEPSVGPSPTNVLAVRRGAAAPTERRCRPQSANRLPLSRPFQPLIATGDRSLAARWRIGLGGVE